MDDLDGVLDDFRLSFFRYTRKMRLALRRSLRD
jgi:hypothetical protein